MNFNAIIRGQMRVISVTSGKGGVGKTTLASALAVRAARESKRFRVFLSILLAAVAPILQVPLHEERITRIRFAGR